MRRQHFFAGMAALLCVAGPAAAQLDLSGVWTPRYHEDQEDRIPGVGLADYLGLPINEAARLSALSWDASRVALPEHQCRVHISPYVYRGPLSFRSWEERHPETQELIAIKHYITTWEQTRTIWMNGRPHPPAWASHTWMGFSTGRWVGDVLVVTTTHIKQGWVRRNGVPQSDQATMVEYFIRHGDHLTHVHVITDPVYLEEPLIRSQDFVLEQSYQGSWLFPCEPVVEVADRRKGKVPSYLPGQNPYARDSANKLGVPFEAATGGAETTYPEYAKKLKAGGDPRLTPRPVPLGAGRPEWKIGDDEIHLMPVQGSVYMLVGPGGNVAVQAGEQGLLLVDTMTADLSGKVLETASKLSSRKLRFIINTSDDADHIGGNEKLRAAGTTVIDPQAPGSFHPTDAGEGAGLIAHENVLARMSAPTGETPPMSPGAWPTATLFDDEKALFFNGEAIRILTAPKAHTDGDLMVFFRRSDVVATGDIFSTLNYPVIDVKRGGSVEGVIDALNRLVEIAIPEHSEEGGTMIIPGHGRLSDRADVVLYRDMVTIIRDRVRAMKHAGMALEQVQAARPTLDYDPEYGATTGEWTTRDFVEAVYNTIE